MGNAAKIAEISGGNVSDEFEDEAVDDSSFSDFVLANFQFRRCCVGERICGDDVVPFYNDYVLVEHLKANLDGNDVLFFKALALCNYCKVTKRNSFEDEEKKGFNPENYSYECDLTRNEVTICENTKKLGIVFTGSTYTKSIKYMRDTKELNIFGQCTEIWYRIRNVGFTSKRKRISIIFLNEYVSNSRSKIAKTAEVYIFMKGEPEEMLKRVREKDYQKVTEATKKFINLNSSEDNNEEQVDDEMDERENVKYLAVAYKKMKFLEWIDVWKNLKAAEENGNVKERKDSLDEIYNNLEQDMILLGCIEICRIRNIR